MGDRQRRLADADAHLHLADAHVAGSGCAWTYELGWGYGPNGASHSLDVLLLLDTIDYDEVRSYATSEPNAADEARHVSRRMRADWIAFATTGDPGWAPYDVTTRSTRVHDAEPTTQPYPEEAPRRIWHHHRFDSLDLPQSPPASDAGPTIAAGSQPPTR